MVRGQLTVGRRAAVAPSAVWELVPRVGSNHVGLGPVCPKDGSDILLAIKARAPGKFAAQVAITGEAALVEDGNYALFKVQRVHVKAVNVAAGQDLLAHFADNFHAKLFASIIVVFYRLQTGTNFGGNLGLAHVRHALPAAIVVDGHDSWKNGNSDTSSTHVGAPLDKVIRIVEQLGDDDVSARLNLLLQVPEVVLVRDSVDVALRVTSDRNAEKVTMFVFDVADLFKRLR